MTSNHNRLHCKFNRNRQLILRLNWNLHSIWLWDEAKFWH